MNEARGPRFDFPVLVIGVLLAAALGVGLATAFLYISRSSSGPDVGPTAASVDDGFSTLFGAALGLFVGSLLTSCFARRGSRLGTGTAAGFLAYGAALVPIFVATGSSDVTAAEWLGIALLLGVPLGLCVLVGAVVGAGLGDHRQAAAAASGRR